MGNIIEQLLLESAWRVIRFAWQAHMDEGEHIEPELRDGIVLIDCYRLRGDVTRRLFVAASAESLEVDMHQLTTMVRFTLAIQNRPNRLLDLMGDYHIWKKVVTSKDNVSHGR